MQYMDALDQKIRDQFPTQIINVLEAFHIFDAVMVPEDRDLWQQGSPNFQEPLLQGQH